MPVKIKLGLSLMVVVVAAIAFYFQHMLGHDRIQYVVAFLGFFMIFAMWLFPKSSGTKPPAALAATRQRDSSIDPRPRILTGMPKPAPAIPSAHAPCIRGRRPAADGRSGRRDKRAPPPAARRSR